MTAFKRKQEKAAPVGRKKAKVEFTKSAETKKSGTKSTQAVAAALPKSKKPLKPVVQEPDPESEEPSEDEEYGSISVANEGEEDVHEDDNEDEDEDTVGVDADSDQPMNEKTEEEITKARASRAEQKRLIAERKQAKPLGNIIQKSKKIWEQIRRKDLSKEERAKKIEEHQSMIRGQIKDLAFKHDTSRVVQTALKYGSKSIREEVSKELKGTYVSLAQSSYGKYLVVKVMHYGSPETRKSVAGEFIGHVKKLIRHREASFVIEDIYREYGTPEQKAQMVREFYGVEFAVFGKEADADPSLKKILEKSPEKRAVILKHMLDLLTAIVEKGAFFFTIVHRAMLEFVSNVAPGTADATEIVELVKDHGAEVAFSRDGTQVMMRTLALGNAKDRKAIIKAVKPVAHQVAAHETGHTLLLTLMDVVDDTVLVNKSIFSEFQQHLTQLATNKFGRIPLLYPFVGRKNRLISPSVIAQIEEMDKIRGATSKKDPEVRREELRAHLSPIVLQGVAEHAADLVQDSFGCQFIAEVLLGADGDKSAAMSAVASLAAGDPTEDGHIATTAAGGRMLKTLVAGGHYNSKLKKVETINPPLGFHQVLYDSVADNVAAWATGAGSFVVLSLLETDGFTHVAELKAQLRKCKKGIAAAAKAGNKGSAVVEKKL